MVKKLFFFLILIPFFSLFAQEIKVTASTDTTDYLIGDRIKYFLNINTDKNVYIINPFFRDSLRDVDVISISNPVITENDSGKTIKYTSVLSRFDSAQVTIPPIKIEYRVKGDTTLKNALSNPVTFNVHTLKVSIKEDIKDIKPPMRLFNYAFLIYILIGLLLIAAGYFIYIRYIKNKPEKVVEKKEEKILSHQLALRKLDQLESEKLWQKGFVKDYHTRITEIIREYFGKQFGLPALELTTTESLNLLRRHSQGKKVLDITSQFLNNADLVKFAKFIPLETVNTEMMTQAREIVSKTMSIQKEEVKEAANV
jgi:large-conductance mechanosensitive channel